MSDHPENLLAIATVHGIPGVLVLRRRTSVGFDWAHTLVEGVTCSHDDEVELTSPALYIDEQLLRSLTTIREQVW